MIRARQSLAKAGTCAVALRYDQARGKLLGSPRMTLRGFAANRMELALGREAREVIQRAVQSVQPHTSPKTVERVVQRALTDFFYRRTKNRPETIVIVLEE